MSIIYACVAHKTTILAEHSSKKGNFTKVVQVILEKISPAEGKMTYTFEQYVSVNIPQTFLLSQKLFALLYSVLTVAFAGITSTTSLLTVWCTFVWLMKSLEDVFLSCS